MLECGARSRSAAAHGSRPRAPDRSRSRSVIERQGASLSVNMTDARTAGVHVRAAPRLRLFALGIALAATLAACSSAKIATIEPLPTPQPERTILLTASEQREHLRILAAYGGTYENPKVQGMLEKTVDKLVAA